MKNFQPMERAFEGVFVPQQIWLFRGLTSTEKMALCEIKSLDATERGCYASNDYLSYMLGVTTIQVSRIVSKLKDMGFFSVCEFNGRNRKIRINHEVFNDPSKCSLQDPLNIDVKADLTSMLKQPYHSCKGSLNTDVKQRNIDKKYRKKKGEIEGEKHPPVAETTAYTTAYPEPLSTDDVQPEPDSQNPLSEEGQTNPLKDQNTKRIREAQSEAGRNKMLNKRTNLELTRIEKLLKDEKAKAKKTDVFGDQLPEKQPVTVEPPKVYETVKDLAADTFKRKSGLYDFAGGVKKDTVKDIATWLITDAKTFAEMKQHLPQILYAAWLGYLEYRYKQVCELQTINGDHDLAMKQLTRIVTEPASLYGAFRTACINRWATIVSYTAKEVENVKEGLKTANNGVQYGNPIYTT